MMIQRYKILICYTIELVGNKTGMKFEYHEYRRIDLGLMGGYWLWSLQIRDDRDNETLSVRFAF